MVRSVLLVWLSAAVLAACTPLGLWMYEDPHVAVSRVSVARARAGRSVRVALAVDNRNDYAVEATHVEIALRVDGEPVGQLVTDTLVALPEAVVSLVAVPLRLTGSSGKNRAAPAYRGTHQYRVEGRAEFRTPIGIRRVVFQEAGAMQFGAAVRAE